MIEPLLALGGLLIGLALGAWLHRRSSPDDEGLRLENARLRRARDAERRGTDLLEAQLEALGLAVLEVVVIVDDQRMVQRATPGARALFEMGESATGRSLIEFTRSAEIDQLAGDALAHGRTTGGARDELDRVIPLAGRPFRVRAAAFDGGAVLALSDVSELQRLGRARRDFVANISHELRTPLTAIRLLLENLLAEADRLPGDTIGPLRKIHAETETLQQIAQELLDLAQIESGRTPVRLVPTSVAALISASVERFAPQAERKDQTLRVEAAPDLTALADADLVGRALGNLLHNAIKFTPPGGQIWVRAYPLDGDVVVEVADTGPGIPPEEVPRVFERFFRGDRARSGGGTGLGLAIAKHVVEAHGGRIWVEREGRAGFGATFCFSLLAADAPG